MNTTNTPKGADITVEFILSSEDTGTPLNLALYPGITVHIYQKGAKKILRKYSRVTTTGYTTLTVTDAAAGKIEIYIPRSITKDALTDRLLAEIKVRKADAGAESNEFHSIATDILIDLLLDSITPTESIP